MFRVSGPSHSGKKVSWIRDRRDVGQCVSAIVAGEHCGQHEKSRINGMRLKKRQGHGHTIRSILLPGPGMAR